ncbi:MAG: ubiquinol-cytochrome C chaperone family protein [Alphaproteobacteria bacterium]
MSALFARGRVRAEAHISVAERLYGHIVGQARQPAFYQDMGVPDTPLGRFDMISLHAFLLFRRLSGTGRAGRALGQAVHDVMFADMDRSLREMGVGDLGVGKRVKKLAKNLYGRINAYDEGLKGADEDLEAALGRNVFADSDAVGHQITALVRYMRQQVSVLEGQEDSALMDGKLVFGTVDPAVNGREDG